MSPVQHRSAQAQLHLTEIRVRALLVSSRTALVNAAPGLVKSYGERLRKCDTRQVRREASGLSAGLREALEPLLQEIDSLNEGIQEYDRRIAKMAKATYPEVELLKQSERCRRPDCYDLCADHRRPASLPEKPRCRLLCRLAPGRRNSGESEPQLHISKEGDEYLRMLLVQGAHYILGPVGKDSDLRRWGQKLAERGGKNGKKRAVVAARKLAVLLHRLWVSGEVYEPLRNSQKTMPAVA